MKDKIMVFGFLTLLNCFFLISLFTEEKLISKTERRNLSPFPPFHVQTIWNGEFFASLNTYVTEQFPFRDSLREGKAFFLRNVFQKKEYQGAIVQENFIFQLEVKSNENSIRYFTNKLNAIQEEYFPKKKVYYAIIPDKNYYAEDAFFPKLDYLHFNKLIQKQLNSFFYEINLQESLTLDSYYRTDLHWRQEKLKPVLKILQKELNLPSSYFFEEEKLFFPFYGSYYSKGSSSIEPDTLIYLTSPIFENVTVYNYEKGQFIDIYPEENLKHIDAYDIFLDGATPLLILENKKIETNRELILFRDSFSSSLAPLLLANYRKITLIDLRYLSSSLLKNIPELDFEKENQDVLFLYSVPIINQSFTLK